MSLKRENHFRVKENMGRFEFFGTGMVSQENIIITVHGDTLFCNRHCTLILTAPQELHCSHPLFFVEEEEAEAERFCNLTISH